MTQKDLEYRPCYEILTKLDVIFLAFLTIVSIPNGLTKTNIYISLASTVAIRQNCRVSSPAIIQPSEINKEMISAFIEGVQKTMSLLAGVSVATGKATIEQNKAFSADVAGLIGMVFGQRRGRVIINYQKDTIIKIVNSMLDEEFDEINADVTDAVGELTNQIYGTAKTTLSNKGYQLAMAIPTVLHGNFKVFQPNSSVSIVVPFNVPDLDVSFGLELTVER